ncbi:MAG: hypothetical protein ACLPUO_03115 [Streptosporangiaceae bacterium]
MPVDRDDQDAGMPGPPAGRSTGDLPGRFRARVAPAGVAADRVAPARAVPVPGG